MTDDLNKFVEKQISCLFDGGKMRAAILSVPVKNELNGTRENYANYIERLGFAHRRTGECNESLSNVLHVLFLCHFDHSLFKAHLSLL